jgi:hypothetical protein
MQNVSCSQHPDDADQNPKCVEKNVGGIALARGAPCQDDGVRGIEDPDEHERALRPEPAHKAEAKNAHEHANHFDGFELAVDKYIHGGIFDETSGLGEQMFAAETSGLRNPGRWNAPEGRLKILCDRPIFFFSFSNSHPSVRIPMR